MASPADAPAPDSAPPALPDMPAELASVPAEYRATRVSTRTVQRLFLECFAACGSLTEAAQAAGVRHQRHYEWLARDPQYAQRFAEAERRVTDLAEAAAVKRGVLGLDEPVFGRLPGRDTGSGVIGTRKVYSDRLLELLLRARRPERYRQDQGAAPVQVQVQVGIVQQALAQVPEDALRALVAALRGTETPEAPALPAPVVRVPEPAPLVRVDTMPAPPAEPAPGPRRGPGRPPGARDKRRRKRRKDTPGARKAREARAARKDAAASNPPDLSLPMQEDAASKDGKG